MAPGGTQKVSLSETLVVPDASMGLLSVPALTRKDVGVLLMPGFVILYDLSDDLNDHGYAEQDSDGLYFISDDSRTNLLTVRSMNYKAFNAMTASVVSKAKLVFKNANKFSESSTYAIGRGSISLVTKATDDKTFRNSKKAGDSRHTKKFRRVDAVKIEHLRLGHESPVKVKSQIRDGLLPHVRCPKTACKTCITGKFRQSVDGLLTKSIKIGTLHMGTNGSLDVESVHSHIYFAPTIEKCSRFDTVPPIKLKSNTAGVVLRIINYFEKKSGHLIQKVHTDEKTEFSRALVCFENDGASVSTTTAYINARVEWTC